MRIKSFLVFILNNQDKPKIAALEIIYRMSEGEFAEFVEDLKASVELDEALADWNTKVKKQLEWLYKSILWPVAPFIFKHKKQ